MSDLDLSKRAVIEREIAGAIKSTIAAHGPVTEATVSSAAKRVFSALKAVSKEKP